MRMRFTTDPPVNTSAVAGCVVVGEAGEVGEDVCPVGHPQTALALGGVALQPVGRVVDAQHLHPVHYLLAATPVRLEPLRQTHDTESPKTE